LSPFFNSDRIGTFQNQFCGLTSNTILPAKCLGNCLLPLPHFEARISRELTEPVDTPVPVPEKLILFLKARQQFHKTRMHLFQPIVFFKFHGETPW